MFFYRADVFEKLGIDVPTTWDEYADAARTLPPGAARHLPRHVLRERRRAGSPAWPSRPARPGGRVDGRRVGGRHRRRADAAGRRLLGRPGRGGRHRQQADVHPGVEQRAQHGKQVGWVERRLGARRARGQRRQDRGQVGDGADAAVGRRARDRGSWGGSSTARHHPVRSTPSAAAEFIAWLNTDPEAVRRAGRAGRHLPRLRVARRPRSTRRRRSSRTSRTSTTVAAEAASTIAAVHLWAQRERHLQRLQRRVRQGRREPKSQAAFLAALAAMQADDRRPTSKTPGSTSPSDGHPRPGRRTRRPRAAPVAARTAGVARRAVRLPGARDGAVRDLPRGADRLLALPRLRQVRVRGWAWARAPAARSGRASTTTAAR